MQTLEDITSDNKPFTDEEIRSAFETFDLDKNGFVGVSEIKHLLSLIGESVNNEEIDEMVRMCDAEGVGQVTFEGFYRLFSRTAALSVAATPAGPTHSMTTTLAVASKSENTEIRAWNLEQVLEKFTEGQNLKPQYIKRIYKKWEGRLSTKIKYLQLLELLEVDDSALTQRLFDLVDFDAAGGLDIKDLVIVLSNHTGASRVDKLKFAFLIFDEQGRGYISREELLRLLRANLSDLPIEDLALRAAEVLRFAGQNIEADSAKVTYEQFMTLAKTNASLVFPVMTLGAASLNGATSIEQKVRRATSSVNDL
jgi:Ca2+-binding EF-hand superfamily protein